MSHRIPCLQVGRIPQVGKETLKFEMPQKPGATVNSDKGLDNQVILEAPIIKIQKLCPVHALSELVPCAFFIHKKFLLVVQCRSKWCALLHNNEV